MKHDAFFTLFAFIIFLMDLIALHQRKKVGNIVNSDFIFCVHYVVLFLGAVCALTAGRMTTIEYLALVLISLFIYFVCRVLFPSYLLRRLNY
jgi:hypothetical protein